MDLLCMIVSNLEATIRLLLQIHHLNLTHQEPSESSSPKHIPLDMAWPCVMSSKAPVRDSTFSGGASSSDGLRSSTSSRSVSTCVTTHSGVPFGIGHAPCSFPLRSKAMTPASMSTNIPMTSPL